MPTHSMPSHHGVEEHAHRVYPNTTMQLLMERASCRSFVPRKIPCRILNAILEAGTHAPTAGNLQPYSIIKIEHRATKKALADMCGQSFIAQAPVDLLFCIDWYRLQQWAEVEAAPFSATRSFRHFWVSFQDTLVCAQNICTAADSLGLGSVYIGTVLEVFRPIQAMFCLPRGVFPVVLLCLGYPKAKRLPRRKLGVDVVVHNEKYHTISDKALKAAFNRKYPDVKIEINEARLERIADVCRKIHGVKFAKQCLTKIRKNGYINMAQRYFGLHYAADSMLENNAEYMKIMEDFGFTWFEKHHGRHATPTT